jgi:hypothetical protein
MKRTVGYVIMGSSSKPAPIPDQALPDGQRKRTPPENEQNPRGFALPIHRILELKRNL